MTEELHVAFPILSVLLLLPLAGALLMWLLQDEDLIKKTALGISILELVPACPPGAILSSRSVFRPSEAP